MYKLDPTPLTAGDVSKPLPVLPLRNVVVYPGTLMPLTIGRPKSLSLFENIDVGSLLVVATQYDEEVDDPVILDLYSTGTVARVLEVYTDTRGALQAIVQGLERVNIDSYDQEEPYFSAYVEILPMIPLVTFETTSLVRSLRELSNQYIEMLIKFPAASLDVMSLAESPLHLAYTIITHLTISVSEKQEILEEDDSEKVLRQSLEILSGQIEALKVSEKINLEVSGELTKNQRDFFLRQQVKGIRKELGEEDDEFAFIDEMKDKLAKAQLPADVHKIASKELKRLGTIQPSSPEYTVARTYLECLAELPWNVYTEDNHDIENAEVTLDRDHYGLEKVKERILEFLAVNSLRKDGRSPILCLVGPPGVGKTSLGKSIAEALNRKYQRISLGGVRDEAEIRGHRRTYIGAMPGKFIKTIKRAGSKNPVLILDEIDKLGSDWRGDPTSALLEVLDPAQNNEFMDHYLDVPFDLSSVMFVATANSTDGIPKPLLDRMEVIDVSSYTVHEKTEIAKRHLLPRQIEEHGLKVKQLTLKDDALQKIIVNYTREPGVRNLERELAAVCRKFAVSLVKNECQKKTVRAKDLNDLLGPEKHIPETAERTKLPGIVTGLAWTSVGGEILFIESTRSEGEGKLKLTGKLGDVMKESAEIAMSYLQSNAKTLKIPFEEFSKNNFHVHVPQGAVPKDGPSAGVTMVTALTSLMTNVRARGDLAMTGEMTLRGNVLPIGGVKEKVLAAHRAGIQHVILPERNEKDIVDIPSAVQEEMTFHFVSQIDEVLKIALSRN